MANYLVRWEIEVEADSPEAAILEARAIQRDPNSTATEFEVIVDGKGKFHNLDNIKYCYQCDAPVSYLFPDGRCGKCTRLTTEEVQG